MDYSLDLGVDGIVTKCIFRKHKGSVWNGHLPDNTSVRSLFKTVRFRLLGHVSFLEQSKRQSVTEKT